MIQPAFSAAQSFQRPQLVRPQVTFGCAGKNHPKETAEAVQAAGKARKQIVAEMDAMIAKSSGLKKLGLKMIRAYKNSAFIHEKLYKWINLKCAYALQGNPSCSQYGFAAVQKHGFFKGSLMALGRIMNCNPISMKTGLTKRLFTAIV